MSDKKIPIILLLLTAVTLLAFWQVNHCEFIDYDDDVYITANSHVQNGITIEGIRWAFTTSHANFWHPLTWISHMLDVQLYGSSPRGHHLTSLLLHIANTLMLFLVFHRMTKTLWQSAFVAALFALHPLHVESVAWVADRKDVLSTAFWMLTMGAYLLYVERPGLLKYLAVVLFFALGLMAKPMLVTLPFVLLLLDFWPLHRFEQKKPAPDIRPEVKEPASEEKQKGKSKKKHAVKDTVKTLQLATKTAQTAEVSFPWERIRPLLWEKIPLFALTVLASIAAFIAQQKGGAVGSIEAFPLSARVSNALVSYILYIAKMIWPGNLALVYPHPGVWPLWQVLGAVFIFITVTFLAIRWAKRFPFLPVGWLWYVGTLVPVIGLVQVGSHGRADRYTYVPLIGLFIIAAWGIPELLKRWRFRKKVLVALSASILAGLFMVTRTQVGYWQNSITLFDHTLNVTDHNGLIHNNRGAVYSGLGYPARAIEDFNRAIEIYPNDAAAYNNRGIAYGKLGNRSQAISDFNRAIEIDPNYAAAYNNRGNAYGNLGDHAEAISDFNRAIEIDPNDAVAHTNRGIAYGNLGNRMQAIRDFDRAIEIDPNYTVAYYNRGIAYGSLGDHTQAIKDFDRAIEIDPNYAVAYYNRGIAYDNLGKYERAYEDLRTAARLGSEEAKYFLRSRRVTRQ
jgi:tetratricopeptide (TPR) repeat protein